MSKMTINIYPAIFVLFVNDVSMDLLQMFAFAGVATFVYKYSIVAFVTERQ